MVPLSELEAKILERVTAKKASMEGVRKFFTALPFLGPFLFLIILFYLVPVILTFTMSLTSMDYALEWNFVGLKNFVRFFQDSSVKIVVLNTVKYVVCTLIINVGFGFFLAVATSYFIKNENLRLAFQTIWMLPRMTPPVVYALLWLWFLDPTEAGTLNSVLHKLFGLPAQNWILNHPMKVVIVANGLIGTSLAMVVFSAAIKSIPVDYFRAASVDGASDWDVVRHVIVPFLKWPIMFMTIWQTLSLITSYEYILLITDGGPLNKSEVLSLFSYHKAFSNYEFGYGAAISTVLVIFAVILAVVMLKVFGYDAIMMRGEIDEKRDKDHISF